MERYQMDKEEDTREVPGPGEFRGAISLCSRARRFPTVGARSVRPGRSRSVSTTSRKSEDMRPLSVPQAMEKVTRLSRLRGRRKLPRAPRVSGAPRRQRGRERRGDGERRERPAGNGEAAGKRLGLLPRRILEGAGRLACRGVFATPGKRRRIARSSSPHTSATAVAALTCVDSSCLDPEVRPGAPPVRWRRAQFERRIPSVRRNCPNNDSSVARWAP